jgi:hypothetical protein
MGITSIAKTKARAVEDEEAEAESAESLKKPREIPL